jgi:cobalt-zinc-cadmium resistance protein CzcA
MIKNGVTESVGGIVMMIRSGNAKEIVSRVKKRVDEINAKGMLPDGLKIVPYYDRSELVDAALWTVTKVLLEGVVFVMIVLFLFLGDLRSSLVVIATLVLTPLITFIVMNRIGLSANLMSLGGLAIAIGLMVDGSVVVVENAFAQLGHRKGVDRLRVVFDAVRDVATPVVFGIGIIVLVFLPLMTLTGMEGKMFAPLAYTIAIALTISLVISLTLTPALSLYVLKGGDEHDTWLIRHLKRPYLKLLHLALRNPVRTVGVAGAAFVAALALVPLLGTSFIPEMKEGSVSPNMDRVANISLNESIAMEMEAMKLVRDIPGVKVVVSRLGRGDSPADPAGPNEADVIATLLPRDQWPKGWTQDTIADAMREKLARFPGVQVVMAQPISDRVDEMVTGVRSDVAVKIFGDDMEMLREKAGRGRGGGRADPGAARPAHRARRRPAVPDADDRPAGDRARRAQCGRRARRDRDGDRRQGRHRHLRGRTPLPGGGASARVDARLDRRDPQDHTDGAQWRAGAAGQPGAHRSQRRPRADQPRDRQASHRRGDQRAGPRPGRLRRGAAPEGRGAGEAAGGLLLRVGRAPSRTWNGRSTT